MALHHVTTWQWATLIAGFLAIVGISAVALVLGRDAVIAVGAVFLAALLGVVWLVTG